MYLFFVSASVKAICITCVHMKEWRGWRTSICTVQHSHGLVSSLVPRLHPSSFPYCIVCENKLGGAWEHSYSHQPEMFCFSSVVWSPPAFKVNMTLKAWLRYVCLHWYQVNMHRSCISADQYGAWWWCKCLCSYCVGSCSPFPASVGYVLRNQQ